MALERLSPKLQRSTRGYIIRFDASPNAKISPDAADYLGSPRVEWYVDRDQGTVVLVPSIDAGFTLVVQRITRGRAVRCECVQRVFPALAGHRYKMQPHASIPKALMFYVAHPMQAATDDAPAIVVDLPKRRAAGREHIRESVWAAKGHWKASPAEIAAIARRYELTQREVVCESERAEDEYAAEQRERRLSK